MRITSYDPIPLFFMKKIFLISLLTHLFFTSAYADKVLVTIGKSGQVTEQQLEAAMKAAPFATQFPAMDEKDQAYLRGDMLLRLARAEALYQEAIETNKHHSTIFQQEMGNFKTSLLAQRYLTRLREQIQIPELLHRQLSTQYQSNSDALTAARSAYIAKHFATIKTNKINELIRQAHVKTYFERLDNTPATGTILAQGNGLTIKYGDLLTEKNQLILDKQRVIDKTNEWIKLILMANAAAAQGENIDLQMQEYAHNLVIRLLLAEKEQQWIPNEKTLLEYFQKHPNIGYIPEHRQIGQIVLATKKQAEDIRARIVAGESLFKLAGQYSIDPYGRQHSGDMGWLTEGSAGKEIEVAIKKLKDNEVSDIIKTDKGWHLITIINRKPSERKNFTAIKDRVRQKFLAEKMTTYLQKVMSKHPLQWHMAAHIEDKN